MSKLLDGPLEVIVRALEGHACPGFNASPGTTLSRVLLNKDCSDYSRDSGDAEMGWRLAVGYFGHSPMHVFYGKEIKDAFSKAVSELLPGMV